jgi:hypothetical protein
MSKMRRNMSEVFPYVIQSAILVVFLVSIVAGMLQLALPEMWEDSNQQARVSALGICTWVICCCLGILYGISRWRRDERKSKWDGS